MVSVRVALIALLLLGFAGTFSSAAPGPHEAHSTASRSFTYSEPSVQSLSRVRIPRELRSLAQPTASQFAQTLTAFELVEVAFDAQPISVQGFTSAAVPESLHQYPSAASVSFTALGHGVSLALERNEALFAPRYTETRQVWIGGVRHRDKETSRVLSDVPRCHYHGSAVARPAATYLSLASTNPLVSSAAESSSASSSAAGGLNGDPLPPAPAHSFAALSTCTGGLDGLLMLGGVAHGIRPALAHLTADAIEEHLTQAGRFQARVRVEEEAARERVGAPSPALMGDASTSVGQVDPLAFGGAGASAAGTAGTAGTAAGRQRTLDLGTLHVVYRMDSVNSPSGGCGVGHVAVDDHVNAGLRPDAPATLQPDNAAHAQAHAHGPHHSDAESASMGSGRVSVEDTIAGIAKGLGAGAQAGATLARNLERLRERQRRAAAFQDSSASMGATGLQSAEAGMGLQTTPSQVWVELLVGNDHARYTAEAADTETDSAAMVNVVAALYNAANTYPAVRVVLVAQVTFTAEDPYSVSLGTCSACAAGQVGVSDLLNSWNAWRSGAGNAPAHDDGQLFSGLQFQTGVLGYASVGGLCLWPYSGGVDTTYQGSVSFTATVIAHELGHNLGSQHDGNGNACPTSGFIMNAVVSQGSPPTQFSTCSKNYMQTFLDGSVTCVLNEPTSSWTDEPVCGNGIVEDGEQCDCGQTNCASVDSCCNGATCQFASASYECSSQSPCCTSGCMLVPASASQVCRAAVDSCDFEETCDGTSGACPADIFQGAGTSCSTANYGSLAFPILFRSFLHVSMILLLIDSRVQIPPYSPTLSLTLLCIAPGSGTCYNGACLSLVRQCRTQTTSFSGGPFSACSRQSQFNGGNYCGNMYCSSSSSSGSDCYSFTMAGVTMQVQDGVGCASGRQCLGGSCVPSAMLNTRFSFVYSDWSDCTVCSEQQTRNVTCVDDVTDAVVASTFPRGIEVVATVLSINDIRFLFTFIVTPLTCYIPPIFRPFPSSASICSGDATTSRTCINEDRGCYAPGHSSSDEISILGYTFTKTAVILMALGCFLFFVILWALCYYFMTKGGSEAEARADINDYIEKLHESAPVG